MRAHALKDVEDGDLFIGAVGLAQLAGRDRATIEHESRDVETRKRHDGSGHVLVAASDADQAVEAVAARDEFD